jgi:hypothetical protein
MTDLELAKALRQVAQYCKERECGNCNKWNGSKCKIMKAYPCDYETELELETKPNEDIIEVGGRYIDRYQHRTVEVISKGNGTVCFRTVFSEHSYCEMYTWGIGSFLREFESIP